MHGRLAFPVIFSYVQYTIFVSPNVVTVLTEIDIQMAFYLLRNADRLYILNTTTVCQSKKDAIDSIFQDFGISR